MTQEQILSAVSAGTLTVDAAMTLIAALNKESKSAPYCKVSEKGACSFYGVGRLPVTLYREQWETVIEHIEMVKEFLTANSKSLKLKSDRTPEEIKAQSARTAAAIAASKLKIA